MKMKIGTVLKVLESPVLEADVISVIEVVYPDDGLPFFKQKFADFPANEAGATCH